MASKPTIITYLGKIGKHEYLFLIKPYNKQAQFDIYHAGFHGDLFCFYNDLNLTLQSKGYIRCRRDYRKYLLNINRYNFTVRPRNKQLLKDIKDGTFINYER